MATSNIINQSSPLKWRRHAHCKDYTNLTIKELGHNATLSIINANMNILSTIAYKDDPESIIVRDYGSPLQATVSNGEITIGIANSRLYGMTDVTVVSDSSIWGG